MSNRKLIRPQTERELRIAALQSELEALMIPPDMFKKDFLMRVDDYEEHLVLKEYSKNTIIIYLRIANRFINDYTDDVDPLRKGDVLLFKDELLEKYDAVQTINTYITSVGKFLHFCEQGEYNIKKVKGDTSNVREDRIYDHEYRRMYNKAKASRDLQIHYIIKVLGGTGVRINELKAFTTESIKKDHVKVNNKGRIRTVPVPGPLVRELRKYATEHSIEGQLFDYTRDQIDRRLKNLAAKCKVNVKKVHPHAFRHYFGFRYISSHSENKIAELSDILGHTSVETTRIYTRGTLADVKKSMEEM